MYLKFDISYDYFYLLYLYVFDLDPDKRSCGIARTIFMSAVSV